MKILPILLLSTSALASPYRMFQCVGTEGETVFSDRWTGTQCVELWVNSTLEGVQITHGQVHTGASHHNPLPTIDLSSTPEVLPQQ